MTALANRDGTSLLEELMTWMGAATTEPEIKIEEFVEDDRHVIRADMPGVDPTKDIQLSVDGRVLRLRGERRAEEHDEHRSEIRYGSFERRITLPAGTRPEDVTAEYVNGVLTVSMPTTGAEEPTTIPVTHREPAAG
jgi:HSP20 family molecular chaperone IbpA